MGIKYRVVNQNKVIKRVKSVWKKYAKKEGYELQVWEGKGKGWKRVVKSVPRKSK
jgi:hypothetical protein